jgi:hypothetical protein
MPRAGQMGKDARIVKRGGAIVAAIALWLAIGSAATGIADATQPPAGRHPASPRPPAAPPSAPASSTDPLWHLVIAARPSRSFRPDETLGAAFDGGEDGVIDRQLTRRNVAAMTSAGLKPLSSRLRTELGIEAWHWNPAGSWSDPARQQGYWTSSDQPAAPIALSWGYRLPRRGDTVDNANNDDWSRLTDGDRATFWKSNPYLDPAITQDGARPAGAVHDGESHAQWLVVRLDAARPIDHAVIDWGTPFALRYAVQYWTGRDEDDRAGRWVTFPRGAIDHGTGGTTTLALAERPVTTRFLRVLLLAGSGNASAPASDPAAPADWRDRAGFAVREVSFGTLRPDGTFDDAVVHAPSHTGQTFTHVSSTDPWHRATDRNPALEQAGIDRLFTSGLGSGLPVMLPTGLLFDTPENAAAMLRYVAARHYPVKQVELGEEPDGQYGNPADYGALYLTAVDRLRPILPGVTFGGPSLQSAFTDVSLPGWSTPDDAAAPPPTSPSWNAGFVAYLKRHGRLADLGFVSFEYYPFDDICGDIHAKLAEQGTLLDAAMRRLDRDGVPAATPRIISEYGFSAYSGRAMAELPSALLMANIAGEWLRLGGSAAYLFGYPPNEPINQHQACAGYGNMMLFMADADGHAGTAMPTYHTARLLTGAWLRPGHGLHHLLAVKVPDAIAATIAAYAVARPDGRTAVLLINRSTSRTFHLELDSDANAGTAKQLIRPLTGPGRLFSYGPPQYAWADRGPQSRPSRSLPPSAQALPPGPARLVLPPDTIRVVVLPARARAMAQR